MTLLLGNIAFVASRTPTSDGRKVWQGCNIARSGGTSEIVIISIRPIPR